TKLHPLPEFIKVTLPTEARENLIGLALGLPIDLTPAERQQLQHGEVPQRLMEHNFFANNDAVRAIDSQILRFADPNHYPPEFTIKIATCFGKDCGIESYPVFGVSSGLGSGSVYIDAKGKPFPDIVDDKGQLEKSAFQNFIDDNRAPKG